MDIALRGLLCSNDDADILRWWGWRDITAPMDIASALEQAGGEDITLLVNSGGGSMVAGSEIRSILRRYSGKTEALVQSMAASAATFAADGCQTIRSEPGAIFCYHNPMLQTEGDYQTHEKAAEELRNLHEAAVNVYVARTGRSREEIGALLDEDKLISPQQALELGLIDEVLGLPTGEPSPVQLVASRFGGWPQVSASMRGKYQEYLTAQREGQEMKAKRAKARARALARY